MAKTSRRKPHIGKTERRSILRAAAKRKPKPKTKAEKPGRKKRKPEPEPISITRKPRGPNLEPRKKRSDAMATSKREGEDDDKDVKDVKGAKGADYAATTTEGGTGATGATGATGPATVQVWDASSGQMKTMVAP